MKLLYILNNFSIGGAETGLLHLLKQGFFEGTELEILVLFQGSGKLKTMLEMQGFSGKVSTLMPQEKMTIPLLLQAYPKLHSYLKKHHPDLILLSLPQANFLGRMAAKRICPNVPVVTFEHTAKFLKSYYPPLLKITAKQVKAVLYDCAITQEKMRILYPKKSKIPWLYTPLTCVDENLAVKKDYHQQRDVPSILSVGRLNPQKNYAEAIKAIKILKDKGKNLHYYIAGEGVLKNELHTLVEQLNLQNDITFLGFVDWKSLPETMDIFLQASQWEGLCISVIEAMSAGMPVVSTNVGGMLDYGRHNENMIKSEGDDAVSLANALEKILNDSTLRQKIGTQAHCDMVELFGKEIVQQQLKDVMTTLQSLCRT